MPELLIDGGVRIGQESLDETLLARAAGVMPTLLQPQEWAPEQTGAFSIPHEVWGSAGHTLPGINVELYQREKWQQLSTPLGFLASNTEVSLKTGCWGLVDAWRNDKGYAFVWDPEVYGYEPAARAEPKNEVEAKKEFKGIKVHQMAHILLMRELDPDYVLPPRTPLDHLCRFTGCCNPTHTEKVTREVNNQRQKRAHPIEAALALGQVMLGPTGYDFIDISAAQSPTEDTSIVVNTRFGPFRIIKLDNDPLMVRGEPELDNLLPMVRPPAVSKYVRPSRAKSRIHDGQRVIFPKTKYRRGLAKKRPSKPKKSAAGQQPQLEFVA